MLYLRSFANERKVRSHAEFISASHMHCEHHADCLSCEILKQVQDDKFFNLVSCLLQSYFLTFTSFFAFIFRFSISTSTENAMAK
jgi:hypothetical protein